MEGRWIWRVLALPGVLWLSLFFLVAFYAVVAVAFGNTNTLSELVPFWSPTQWNVGYVHAGAPEHLGRRPVPDGLPAHVRLRRHRTRGLRFSSAIRSRTSRPVTPAAWKGLLLLLLVLPFWINYLMRMLAWINLLSPDGWGTKASTALVDRPALHHPRSPLQRGRLARGPERDRRHRARLRLHAVPDHPAVRGARPHRPAPDRGRPRPRRQPVQRVPANHASALDARHPRPASC